jgi:hypothetical protein
MSELKKWSLFLLLVCLTVVSIVGFSAESAAGNPKFSIRKAEQQIVLYTVHRGSYDKAGAAVGRLFALAGQKQIRPYGPASYVYLNNPQSISSEHWLTEIRIPVDKEALKLTGTLGEMTDVKTLPAVEAGGQNCFTRITPAAEPSV